MIVKEVAALIAVETDKYNATPFSTTPVGVPVLMYEDKARPLIEELLDNHGFVRVSHLHIRKDRVWVACLVGALRDEALLRGTTSLMAIWNIKDSRCSVGETRATLGFSLSVARRNNFEGQLLEV